MNTPLSAAFAGQRVLVTNNVGGVSLWKAADQSPIGSFGTPAGAYAACSDGVNFWITLSASNKLARF